MKRGSRGVWVGFGALCLLAGCRWLVEAAAPTLLPAGPRTAIHTALIAIVLGCLTLARRAGVRPVWKICGLGMLVFALPGAVVAGAGGKLAGLTEELVFLLLPVAVVWVMAQADGFGEREDARRLLGPALAGLAGAALLVPFTLPATLGGGMWLALLIGSVLMAGWATVRLHMVLRGQALLPTAAVVAAGCTVLAACSPGWIWVGGLTAAEWLLEIGQALLLDLPVLLLGVWCLRELAPIRFSARALVILLVAIVGSFLAAHPTVTWTMGAGGLLLAGGAGWLLKEGGVE